MSKAGVGSMLENPTEWMTDVPQLDEALDVECDDFHEHTRLFGGTARSTGRHPPKLVVTLLEGIGAYQRLKIE